MYFASSLFLDLCVVLYVCIWSLFVCMVFLSGVVYVCIVLCYFCVFVIDGFSSLVCYFFIYVVMYVFKYLLVARLSICLFNSFSSVLRYFFTSPSVSFVIYSFLYVPYVPSLCMVCVVLDVCHNVFISVCFLTFLIGFFVC